MAEPLALWLTRPREDSEGFAAELTAHAIPSLIAPVMHIVHQPLATQPETPDALLLTSRHAAYVLAALPATWRNLPCFRVGEATAAHIHEYGFTNVHPGNSDILGLLPHLLAEVPAGGRLLYLAGEDTRADVPALLGARGIHVEAVVVYRAHAERHLAPEALEALRTNRIGGVAFFSPRSAAIACALMTQSGLAEAAANITAYCLSLNVAREAGKLPWKQLLTCSHPTRIAMHELILSHPPETV